MLPSLTSVRVFAALTVAVHHTRAAWAHTQLIDIVGQVGFLGVPVFFVLSGFVLMWGFNPQMTGQEFILRRLIRIYPLHVLTLLASLSAFVVLHSPIAGYVGTPWGTVANFLLIHDWIPGHPNIRQAWNGVSWTLSCEFFFYLLAPFVFCRMLRAKNPAAPFIAAAAVWVALFVLAWMAALWDWDWISDFLLCHPIARFDEFALGASGALLLRHRRVPQSRALALAVLTVPLALYCLSFPESSGPRSGPVMVELIVPGVFLLILALAARDNAGKPTWLHAKWLVYLGEASFALYMTHALFLGPFTILRNRVLPISATSEFWGEVATLAYVLLALLISALMHSLLEQPIRVRLMRRLKNMSQPAIVGGFDVAALMSRMQHNLPLRAATTTESPAPMPILSENASQSKVVHWAILGFVRFFLATVVVLGHYHLFIEKDPIHLFGGGYLNPLSAVFGFFIISGYSIAASLDRNAVHFYKRRVFRIFPLYLFSIVFGLIVQKLAGQGLIWPSGDTFGLQPIHIVASLLMLQNILSGPIPILGVTWSLSAEWWLYMVAPILRKQSNIVLGVLAFASYAFFIAQHHFNPIPFAVDGWSDLMHGRVLAGLSWIWIIGFIYYRMRGTVYGFVILTAPAILAMTIGRSPGVPYFVAAFVLILSETVDLPKFAVRIGNFLGDVSYPLYLLHIPTMTALWYLGVGNRFVILLSSIAISVASIYLIEIPANKLRDR